MPIEIPRGFLVIRLSGKPSIRLKLFLCSRFLATIYTCYKKYLHKKDASLIRTEFYLPFSQHLLQPSNDSRSHLCPIQAKQFLCYRRRNFLKNNIIGRYIYISWQFGKVLPLNKKKLLSTPNFYPESSYHHTKSVQTPTSEAPDIYATYKGTNFGIAVSMISGQYALAEVVSQLPIKEQSCSSFFYV